MNSNQFISYVKNPNHRYKFPDDVPFTHNTVRVYEVLEKAVVLHCDNILFSDEGISFRRGRKVVSLLPRYKFGILVYDIPALIQDFLRIYHYDQVIQQTMQYTTLKEGTFAIEIVNVVYA